MGYTINLISTDKRTNSTAAPSGGQVINNARLEPGESTVINPVFRFNITNQQGNPVHLSNLDRFNYMIWSGNLYWIDNIKSVTNDVVEIRATRDPFGTFRTAIRNSSCYITRISQENKISKYDDDNVITPTNKVDNIYRANVATNFKYNNDYADDGGTFSGGPTVFTIYGKDGVNYYVSLRGPQDISDDLMNEDDLWDTFDNALADPAKYIKSMISMPIWDITNHAGAAVSSVKVGNITRAVRNTCIIDNNNRLWEHYYHITLWSNGKLFGAVSDVYDDFRRYNRAFLQCQLRVPFVGVIDCPQEVLSYNYINVFYSVDMITGTGECIVAASNSADSIAPENANDFVINRSSVQMGANVPFATSNTNAMAVMKNLINPVGLVSALVNERQNLNMIGQTDGLGYVDIGHIHMKVVKYEDDGLDYTREKGRPCNQRLQLGSLTSGTYVECLNPSVKITGATKDEIDMINNTLKGGMYIE
jgi:hypothetical protein